MHLRIALFGQHEGQIDVILQRKGVQEVKLLKHKAEVVPAEGGDVSVSDLRKVPALQNDGPGGGPVQSRKNIEKRGLVLKTAGDKDEPIAIAAVLAGSWSVPLECINNRWVVATASRKKSDGQET